MKTNRSCAFAFVALTVMAVPRAARADSAMTTEAEARFNEAKALAKQRRHEEALAKYMQSYALEPRASALLGMAVTETELGRHVEATRHLREYLKHPKAQNVEDVRANLLAPLLEQTGHLHVRAPSGLQTLVDGAQSAPIDDVVDVKPGPHSVAAGDVKRDVTVAKGQTIEVDLTPSPRTVETTPAPSPVQEPPRELAPRSPMRTIVPVVLGVGAVAGVALGVGFALGQKSSLDDAEALRASQPDLCANPASPACRSREDKLSSAKTQGTLSFVSYGVGVAAGLACVATIVFWPRPSSTAGLRVTPVVGASGAGLHLSTSF